MGLTYTEMTLTNTRRDISAKVRFMVDTGAVLSCVPDAVARQLGFDPEEATTRLVTVADGRSIEVPRIGPIEFSWDDNRKTFAEALVLGNEPLLGVVVLESLDLLVDPGTNAVRPPPDRPNFPVYPV